jgi:anti-sigma regulatory factor (Ser/Thr protein kinase)
LTPYTAAMPGPSSAPQALVEQTVGGPNDPARLDEMQDALERFWAAARSAGVQPTDDWRSRFERAVMEIADNVVRHAYPPGHKPGNVKLRLRLYPDRVEALVTDRGIAFVEPADPGHGLTFARAAVDYFEYSRRARGANRWRLLKRLRSP